ncbi:MAG TPA: zinc ABC transporter substrate-binding protein [Magnetovibrio sp.]
MNASRLIRKLAFALLLAIPAHAFASPKVVTSIRPVQALVYAVTGEANMPDVLLDPGTSPHAFSLKPSQAQMLQDADIVFWIGPALETALEGPLQSLGGDAHVVRLLDAPGLDLLHFEDDEHADEPKDEHDHGPVDPHAWLSPANAAVMIDLIETELSRLAPNHAAIYAKNAKVAKNRLKLLTKQMDKLLAHTRGVPYLVQHDGFGYLARDFNLNEVGHLQTLPGREPGAKHVAQIRDAIAKQGVVCIFVEPQFTPALAKRLKEETGIRLGELDPMGSFLDLSPTLHVRIIQQVVLKMDECLFTKPVDATDQQ